MLLCYYFLPKIHNSNIPLPLIVSAVGSSTHLLARYVTRKTRHLIENTEHYLKNSEDFIHKIANFHLDPNDIFSFDMTSLSTKIPINDDSEELRNRLAIDEKDENLVNLARVCVQSSLFTFGGQFYEQIEGEAIS